MVSRLGWLSSILSCVEQQFKLDIIQEKKTPTQDAQTVELERMQVICVCVLMRTAQDCVMKTPSTLGLGCTRMGRQNLSWPSGLKSTSEAEVKLSLLS